MTNEEQLPADHPVTPDEAEGLVEESTLADASPEGFNDSIVSAKISELEELAAERTADLQRLHAEYANYKKRVDRDRALARQGGIEAVVLDLLPVLDSIEGAREHDELTGGFKLVADEIEKVGAKYGLSVYGEVGDPFTPVLQLFAGGYALRSIGRDATPAEVREANSGRPGARARR